MTDIVKLSRAEVISLHQQEHGPDVHLFVHNCEKIARGYVSDGKSYHIWNFGDAPAQLTKLCRYNGGDEDWLVVTHENPDNIPLWLEMMSTTLDIYCLDGIYINVSSHG